MYQLYTRYVRAGSENKTREKIANSLLLYGPFSEQKPKIDVCKRLRVYNIEKHLSEKHEKRRTSLQPVPAKILKT